MSKTSESRPPESKTAVPGAAGHHRRQSPWVAKNTWYGAKERADKAGAAFAAEMRDLVTAYADGAFDIDPREIPENDPSRAGRAMYPTEDGWRRAKDRARREHDVSGSVLAECIALRYMKGHVRVDRTVTVVEVQPVRKNRLNGEQQDGSSGKGE